MWRRIHPTHRKIILRGGRSPGMGPAAALLGLFVWLCCTPAAGLSAGLLTLEVREMPSDQPACLNADVLRERVAHFGGEALLEVPVRAELSTFDAQRGELRLLRDDQEIAVRSFDHLPASCEDRRDVVALALVVALEHAAQDERETHGHRDMPDPNPRVPAATTAPPPGEVPSTPPARADSADAPNARRDAGGQGDSTAEPPIGPPTRSGPAGPDAQGPGGTPAPLTASSAPLTASSRPALASMAPVAAPPPTQGVQRDADNDHRLRLAGAQAGARATTGTLPWAVLTFALGIELAWDQLLTLQMSGFFAPASGTDFAGGELRGRPIGAELLACAGSDTELRAQLCLGVASAGSRVDARGFPERRAADTVFWGAAATRATLRWPARSRLSLQLFVQAHVNWLTPELQILAAGTTRAKLVGAGAGANLYLRLD